MQTPSIRRSVAFGLLSLVTLFMAACGSSVPSTASRSSGIPRTAEADELDIRSLFRATDVGSCRNALQRVNADWQIHSSLTIEAMPEERRRLLTDAKQFNLSSEELSEVEATSFTLLDAQYLDGCFLLRDAAQSLGLRRSPAEGGADKPLARAEEAFAWITRQVRLRESDREPLPPQYVLRRGWGTSLERSIIFLAMLEQLGIEVCLVTCDDADKSRLWACGVLINGEVYLFDMRLGMPLPGANGKGTATLTEACTNPEVLKQLTIDAKFPYDVTPEQTGQVGLRIICSLSSAAPRLKALQDQLQKSGVEVNLAADPVARLKSWAAAAKKQRGEGKLTVAVWSPGATLLRRFLPVEEGGNDVIVPFYLESLRGFTNPSPLGQRVPVQMRQRMLYDFELVRWEKLPPEIRALDWSPELGRRTRGIYGQMFIYFYSDPQSPRNRILRGRFTEVTPELVRRLDGMRTLTDPSKKPADEDEKLREWIKEAYKVYSQLYAAQAAAKAGRGGGLSVEAAQQQVDELWEKGREQLQTPLNRAAAEPMSAEITYQLALYWQEQAERTQAKEEKANAWHDAIGWWMRYCDRYPTAPGIATANRLQARAHESLGELSEKDEKDEKVAAIALLESSAGEPVGLEKTARLYEIQRLKRTK